MAAFRRGSPIANIPQTFKALVVVARRFGVRYVWIDCLCIIHDSRDDWETEAPTMRHVCANSARNIATSTSTGPQGGLFRLRKPQDIQPGIIETTFMSTSPEKYFIFDKSYWDLHMFQGALHHRVWVFQEHFPAPRVLYFASNQILWQCLEQHECEGFPNEIPLHDSFKSLHRLLETPKDKDSLACGQMPYQYIDLWIDLVASYSRCQLTRPSDKLFAFAGIAKPFQEITGDIYLAGMWKSRILDLLDWYIYEPTARLSSEYRAPSWS